jgi:hypothetical protein
MRCGDEPENIQITIYSTVATTVWFIRFTYCVYAIASLNYINTMEYYLEHPIRARPLAVSTLQLFSQHTKNENLGVCILSEPGGGIHEQL